MDKKLAAIGYALEDALPRAQAEPRRAPLAAVRAILPTAASCSAAEGGASHRKHLI